MKKTALTKNIILLIILFAFSILSFKVISKVFAQVAETITISPPTLTLNVNPGDKKEGTLALINDSDTDLTFVTGVYDFIVQDKNGTPAILPKGTIENDKYSGANWIAVYPNTITVPAHQRVQLNYYIQVPINARPGGHYAAIVYQPISAGANKNSGASVKTQIATLVYLTVSGQVNQAARVNKFQAPPFSEYGPVNITTEIENLGDLHITPNGSITVTNLFGQTVYTSPLATRNIFPGNTALDYINKIGSHFMFGRFKASLLASYGIGNNLPLYATVYFWVIPWRIITITLLVIIAIILTVLVIKKKKSKDSQGNMPEKNNTPLNP